MANPRIEVEIGAKVEGLSAGVNQATAQLDKLGKSAQATAPQVDKLTKATSGYNSVGTDFARIIQDAPFGIIGVGNNITQLASSFQQLKNSSGSTGAAVKAALASILSPANALVLGISVLTTAFTILQQKGFFKSEEAAKSLNEELEDYRKNLDNISAASVKGQANAAKELQSFKLLQIQAENTNVPLEKRIEAVNQLQKDYPDYLGNLSKEQILNGNVGESYKTLSESIIAKAKAQAFSNAISENALKIATFENQLAEKQIELEKARAEVLTASTASAATGGIGQPLFSPKAIAEAKVRDILKEQQNINLEILKVKKEDEGLTKRIIDLSSQGAIFTKNTAESTKKQKDEVEQIKRTFEDIQKIQFNKPDISFAPNLPTRNKFELPESNLKNIQSQIQGLTALNQQLQASGLSVEQFYAAIANGASAGFSSLDSFITSLSETQAFINDTFKILEEGAANTLGDVAFAIGDAIGSGGNVLKAGGAALLGGIASIMNQLGQLAIGAGLAVEGIKKALQTLNPAVAIGAGVALIALAGFVSSKAKSLGGAGGGGSGGGSGVGGGAAAIGSSFTGGATGGLFEQNRDVSGEFVVRGTDLVYVLGQANNKINKG